MTDQDKKDLTFLAKGIVYLLIGLLAMANWAFAEWYLSDERVRNRCLEGAKALNPNSSSDAVLYCWAKYPELFNPKQYYKDKK